MGATRTAGVATAININTDCDDNTNGPQKMSSGNVPKDYLDRMDAVEDCVRHIRSLSMYILGAVLGVSVAIPVAALLLR